jgi:Secretion system C-terminal sorting domain
MGLYTSLPVSIESIEMDCIDEHKANLIWKAHAENTNAFEVQYSENGSSWKTIATVLPQSGSVPYQFATDQTARFYRLKMLDDNGNYEYSPIIVNRCRPEVQVEVFPNPATQFANIRLDNSNESLVLVGLYDAAGQLVMTNRFLPEEHRSFWALPVSQLPAGVYHLEVVLSDGARWHEQVVKY